MHVDRDPIDPRDPLQRNEARGSDSVLGMLLIVPGLIALYTFIAFMIWALAHAVGWAVNLTMVAIPLAILATGASLFWFRIRKRYYYGLGEVGAGLVLGVLGTMQATHWTGTTIAALFRQNELLPVALALGSAIFIVVRGFDNMREGGTAAKTTSTQ